MRWHIGIGLALCLPLRCFGQEPENHIVTSTTIIGTPEQPTIEGGFIHRVENAEKAEKDVLVSSPTVCKKTAEEKKMAMMRMPIVTQNIADEFSSDKNIKQLLTTAARDHKLATVLACANQLKLPATVALIPMVESGYQANAVSPKGAKGAWQLMPKTARDYGINSQARENFTASTHAALHLLSDLHQQWGNWTLAFAAYNAGSTRLKYALHHHPDAQGIEDLDLPLETQDYVARLKKIDHALARLSKKNPDPMNTQVSVSCIGQNVEVFTCPV